MLFYDGKIQYFPYLNIIEIRNNKLRIRCNHQFVKTVQTLCIRTDDFDFGVMTFDRRISIMYLYLQNIRFCLSVRSRYN